MCGRAEMRLLGLLAGCMLLLGCASIATTQEDPNKTLTILVPRKVGFKEFATASCANGRNNSCTFSGFAVEVFRTCIESLRLQRRVRYKFLAWGDDVSDPSYDGMVRALVNKEVDGIVGDLTITAQRMQEIDYTHPYIQSTLVMMVPYNYVPRSGQLWNFLQPFSNKLWGSILVLFVSTGLVIFILEHKNPHFHEQGLDWRTRLSNVFWFTSMTLFFSQKAEIGTRLGRVLTIFWLLVVLIFTSSYTASLTSILATQQQLPTINTFSQLQKSNLSIGYQEGSFVANYSINYLKIKPERLIALRKEEDYDASLRNGSVSAILDELPYIQMLLNSECDYTKGGAQIAYFGGFGFAFQKNSTLTSDLSLEILKLEQNGELQKIRDRWIGTSKCNTSNIVGTKIPLQNFGGLFIVMAIIYFLCILLRCVGWSLKWHKQKKDQAAIAPVEEPYAL